MHDKYQNGLSYFCICSNFDLEQNDRFLVPVYMTDLDDGKLISRI